MNKANMLPLTAQLDGETHIFPELWGEATCKSIESQLNKQHARFSIYGQTCGHNRAWREIENFFRR